jgi:hypothetical protein
MFESMKMFLKNKIDVGNEVTRIRTKLHTFLTHNPDVDHYLCDATKQRNTRCVWLGLLFGILLTFMVFCVLFLIIIYYWHALGWLHIPGSFDLA